MIIEEANIEEVSDKNQKVSLFSYKEVEFQPKSR